MRASDIAQRRQAFLEDFLARFGNQKLPPSEFPAWAVNHVRLVLGRDLDQANRYFENAALDLRLVKWLDGKVDTPDWDFPAILFLKTLLDFGDSPRFSNRARQNLREIITKWRQPRPTCNRDNDRIARWPVIHTENHDIMCLTIGLFGQWLAGRDVGEHIRQMLKMLTWRFRRGWVEWHSPSYQLPFLNPLLILARHAPAPALRDCAGKLLNLLLAERALLSVNGYLGGPFLRGYSDAIANDRNDLMPAVLWLAFGCGAGDCAPERSVPFAADTFEPHPVVAALAQETLIRPELDYSGTRVTGLKSADGRTIHYYDIPAGAESDDIARVRRQPISYYNTPHVSMGSMWVLGYCYQARYFNVMFAADPSKSLRTALKDKEKHSIWDKLNARGEVAQHRNWLIARGQLVEEGGLKAESAGGWRLYRVGKGLAAHAALAKDWHVFQVADLEQYADERAFFAALSKPVMRDGTVSGRTVRGEEIVVRLSDMALTVNGREVRPWTDMLHDCPAMRSVFESGVTRINTRAGALTLSAPAGC